MKDLKREEILKEGQKLEAAGVMKPGEAEEAFVLLESIKDFGKKYGHQRALHLLTFTVLQVLEEVEKEETLTRVLGHVCKHTPEAS
jgi:hypothetical protein